MKIRRIAILLAAFCLIVAVEVVLAHNLIGSDSAALPLTTAEPGSTPAAGTDVQSTLDPAPLNTIAPTVPGFTSPPGGGSSVTNAPAATQKPAPTNAPAPTKAPATDPPPPTAEPTEPPTGSVGSTLSSGNFSSNTGTSLNISVSWTATALGNGKARISINGSVNSYSLQVTGLPVSISFGNYSASVTGSSVNVPNDSLSSNSLFSTSIDVDEGAAGTMTVTWKYNGEYSGMSLSDITASGYVYA